MFVLDTNVVSELMRATPDHRVERWLSTAGNIGAVTTAVTVYEIEYGLQRLPEGRRKDDLHRRFEDLAAALSVLPLDDISAMRAGQFHALRDAAGLPSTVSDMMIAGIAAISSAVLVTRNTKDFMELPIQIVDPWQVATQ